MAAISNADAPATIEVTVDQNLHDYINIEIKDRVLQIGFKLHILSFVADAPFYRDSVLIPELMRIVNWFFTYSPATQNELEQIVGA